MAILVEARLEEAPAVNAILLPDMPAGVARAFAAYPDGVRRSLLAVRRLIFETAAASPDVGPISEELKWGEPAYLTPITRSGSTIRLGWSAARPAHCAVYFNCRTTLVDMARERHPEAFAFEGKRAILFSAPEPLPEAPLAACLALALTYHRAKRRL